MTKGFKPFDPLEELFSAGNTSTEKKPPTAEELLDVYLAEVDKEKGNPDPRAKGRDLPRNTASAPNEDVLF